MCKSFYEIKSHKFRNDTLLAFKKLILKLLYLEQYLHATLVGRVSLASLFITNFNYKKCLEQHFYQLVSLKFPFMMYTNESCSEKFGIQYLLEYGGSI